MVRQNTTTEGGGVRGELAEVWEDYLLSIPSRDSDLVEAREGGT